MKNNSVDLNGTIYSYEIDHELKLVKASIAGYTDEQPTIVVFDQEDLRTLSRARKELKHGPTEPDPGAVLSILAASRSDRFVYDRVEYRYDPKDGKWVAWGRVDIDGDCAPDGEHCKLCNGTHNPAPGVTFVTARNWRTEAR